MVWTVALILNSPLEFAKLERFYQENESSGEYEQTELCKMLVQKEKNERKLFHILVFWSIFLLLSIFFLGNVLFTIVLIHAIRKVKLPGTKTNSIIKPC